MDLTPILAILSVLAIAGIAAGFFKKKLFGSVKMFPLIGILAFVVGYVLDMVGVSAMLGTTGLIVLFVGLKFLKIGPFRSYG
jgi:uncharacterized membrane protein